MEQISHDHCVLLRLIAHGLYTKAKKFEFQYSHFYHIGPLGVRMEENKVTAVSEWP